MKEKMAEVLETPVRYDGHDYIIIGDIDEHKAVSISCASTDEDMGSIVLESHTSEYFELYNPEGEIVTSTHINSFAKRMELYRWAINTLIHQG